jgi:NAD(P)-dependent dehydrogenase (short-subunit alcohol dehydrogenase family)
MASLKVVLVTGGNNGIGYETVKALLQSDKAYHVLLGSRSLEKAKLAIEALYKECPESTNTVEAVQVDLTSDESIEKAFEQVKASPGHIDALINNAGMHTSLLHDISRELTSLRGRLRPRIHRRQNLSPRLLH